MKQTAVEWLAEHLCDSPIVDYWGAVEKAKEMEKEQIIDALKTSEVELLSWGISAEKYYNITFKLNEK